jgi:hypothetical protein
MSRIHALAAAALLGTASLAASAQTAPAEPKKPAAAAKAKPTKAVARKAPPKPAPKPGAKKAKPIMMGTDKPLTLRDKDGNIIPTSPDAYNVDSARTYKKK